MSEKIYCLFARNTRGRVLHRHFKSLEGVLRVALHITPSYEWWTIEYGSQTICNGHPDITLEE